MGLPCQDVVSSTVTPSGAICVLADGAGSARLAREGAHCVVVATQEWLKQLRSKMYSESCIDSLKGEWVSVISDALDRETVKFEASRNELASTLLWVSIQRNKALIGHLGDGVIVGLSHDNGVVFWSTETTEYANQTHFTTSSHLEQNVRIHQLDLTGLQTLALLSDGSVHSLLKKNTKEVANAIPQMSQWLNEYPRDEVQNAVQTQLHELIRTKCFDDCALGLVSLAKLEWEDGLHEADPRVMDFLSITCGKPTPSGTQTRLKIIKAILHNHLQLNVGRLATELNLSKAYVRRLLKQLLPRIQTDDENRP